ncbi:MAG: hypothetical protein ACR2J8_07695, partial [Thermomicrobiales bacterium]
ISTASEGDGETAWREAHAAMDALPHEADWPRPFIQGWARARLGIEQHRRGDLDAALASQTAALERHIREDHPTRIAFSRYHIGALLEDLGQPRAAAASLLAAAASPAPPLDEWSIWRMALRLHHVLARQAAVPAISRAAASLEAALAAEHRRLGMPPEVAAGIAAPPPDAPSLTDALALAQSVLPLLPERATPPPHRSVPTPPLH